MNAASGRVQKVRVCVFLLFVLGVNKLGGLL